MLVTAIVIALSPFNAESLIGETRTLEKSADKVTCEGLMLFRIVVTEDVNVGIVHPTGNNGEKV